MCVRVYIYICIYIALSLSIYIYIYTCSADLEGEQLQRLRRDLEDVPREVPAHVCATNLSKSSSSLSCSLPFVHAIVCCH